MSTESELHQEILTFVKQNFDTWPTKTDQVDKNPTPWLLSNEYGLYWGWSDRDQEWILKYPIPKMEVGVIHKSDVFEPDINPAFGALQQGESITTPICECLVEGKHWYIRVPIYEASIHIYTDLDAVSNPYHKEAIPSKEDWIDGGIAYTSITGADVIMVFKEIEIDVIAHEVTHAAFYLLDHRGVATDANNQEPMAYLEGFLMKYITQYIFPYKQV